MRNLALPPAWTPHPHTCMQDTVHSAPPATSERPTEKHTHERRCDGAHYALPHGTDAGTPRCHAKTSVGALDPVPAQRLTTLENMGQMHQLLPSSSSICARDMAAKEASVTGSRPTRSARESISMSPQPYRTSLITTLAKISLVG